MQKLTKFAEEGDTLYKKKKKMETITTTPLLQPAQVQSFEQAKKNPFVILHWTLATSSNISGSLRILMVNYFVSPAHKSPKYRSSLTSL